MQGHRIHFIFEKFFNLNDGLRIIPIRRILRIAGTLIGLVIFGPGKLPGVGTALGKSLREFKDAVHEPAEAKAEIQEAAAEAVKPVEHHGK